MVQYMVPGLTEMVPDPTNMVSDHQPINDTRSIRYGTTSTDTVPNL